MSRIVRKVLETSIHDMSKGCPNMLKKSFIGVLLCAMMLVIIGGVVGAQDKTEITYMM